MLNCTARTCCFYVIEIFLAHYLAWNKFIREIPADTLEDSDQLLNSHKMVYFVFD